jgi:hypothetical protein
MLLSDVRGVLLVCGSLSIYPTAAKGLIEVIANIYKLNSEHEKIFSLRQRPFLTKML